MTIAGYDETLLGCLSLSYGSKLTIVIGLEEDVVVASLGIKSLSRGRNKAPRGINNPPSHTKAKAARTMKMTAASSA